MHVSSELMIQIRQKGVYGVENPLPRSFLGGLLLILSIHIMSRASHGDALAHAIYECDVSVTHF